MTEAARTESTMPHHRAPTAATMTAATIVRPQRMSLQRVPLPRPGPGQVRVRLEGCGVCASNIPPWEGRPWFDYPLAPGKLGHESWGRIDVLGEDVADLNEGDRVALLSDHAYAEYDVADVETVVPLPEALHDQPAPAEPLGCAANIIDRCQIEPGQTVAIVGIGFLGALLTRLARLQGARVIALTRRQHGLAIARQMGADDTVAMEDHARVLEQMGRITGGEMCDVVIEAAGAQWPLDLAGELTRVRGRLIVAGYHQDGTRQINMQQWNWRGLDVINAHEREPAIYRRGMERAIDLVARGELDPTPLYTHTFRLGQLDEALQMTRERPEGFVKALITM